MNVIAAFGGIQEEDFYEAQQDCMRWGKMQSVTDMVMYREIRLSGFSSIGMIMWNFAIMFSAPVYESQLKNMFKKVVQWRFITVEQQNNTPDDKKEYMVPDYAMQPNQKDYMFGYCKTAAEGYPNVRMATYYDIRAKGRYNRIKWCEDHGIDPFYKKDYPHRSRAWLNSWGFKKDNYRPIKYRPQKYQPFHNNNTSLK